MARRRATTRLGLAAAIALTAMASLDAAAARWERVFPDLPAVSMLWYDPPSTYWVTSCVSFDGMELLRTDDGGATWETIDEGLGRGYVNSLCRAGTPYGIVRADPVVIHKRHAGYQRSDDRGATWSEVAFPVADPVFGDQTNRHGLSVSARHADRIAYGQSKWPAGLTVIDLATGESRFAMGASPMWTHPETGEVYYGGATVRGLIDFENLEFVALASGGTDSTGGLGFASDDPRAVVTAWRDLFGWGTDRAPPIRIWGVDTDRHPARASDAAVEYMARPRSVAIHVETNTIVLAGDDGPHGSVVIASGDDGETWIEVSEGEMSGQLYFLTGHDAVYVQTWRDLYRMPLPTALSTNAQIATRWADLKRGH